MIVLLNLINPALPAISVYQGKSVFFSRTRSEAKGGGWLIGEMKSLQKARRLDLRQIKILAALTGPANFCSLRTEFAIINALAMALNRPVVQIDEKEISDLTLIPKMIFKIKRAARALPFYSREPNITISKKSL